VYFHQTQISSKGCSWLECNESDSLWCDCIICPQNSFFFFICYEFFWKKKGIWGHRMLHESNSIKNFAQRICTDCVYRQIWDCHLQTGSSGFAHHDRTSLMASDSLKQTCNCVCDCTEKNQHISWTYFISAS